MMSENLVSEPMSVEESYGSRMYPITGTQSSPMDNILMDSQEPLRYNSAQPQLSMTNIEGQESHQSQQLGVSVSQEMSGSHFQVRPLDPMANNTAVQKILVPSWPLKQMRSNSGEQRSLLPNKRKATFDPMSNDSSAKKAGLTGSLFNSSVMPALSVPNRKVVPMDSMLNSPRIMASSKKKLLSDSAVNRSQSLAQKDRNARVNPPNKAESGSSSVRTKLKESLAAALALVLQGSENTSSAEKNESSVAIAKLGDSQIPVLAPDTGVATTPCSGKSVEPEAATLLYPIEECGTTKSSSATIDPKYIAGDSVETWKFVGQEFQSNPVLSYEDASFDDGFFGKDELLMGNGLTWAMELGVDIVDVKEGEDIEKAKLAMHQGTDNDKKSSLLCSEPLPSPDFLASEIEAELFKLFGGVNKKYKERGRSLLFNLKDKSNPELRESVMSGKIPPEKLCSMTAEELASKELSQWRIAKAEEFDHMKVLPDTEVDLRRLVKKTHKGEFQVVEVERDVPFDIAVGATTISVDKPQDNMMKNKDSRAKSPVQAEEAKVKDELSRKKTNNGDVDGQCQLTIPSDTADEMHGLMVDDIKDLPPIVSLDEFMESLDKEPPFENLHGDSGSNPGSGKETSDVGADSSDQSSKDPVKKVEHKSAEVDSKSVISNAKATSVLKGPEIGPASGLIKGERIWEGLLQLSVSSMANFIGIFRSGEKTSTKEWPRFFEIKGRVRLDAFQKFLQDLPKSRSRAVMVIQFALAEECTDDDSKNLEELVDSYVVDQRLGFAEPASGFEIYFIPAQTAMIDMLSEQLAKEYTDTLKTIENGMIGVVVWRRAHVTPTIHKENGKRQQQQQKVIGSSRASHDHKDTLNTNVKFASPSIVSSSSSFIKSRSQPNNNKVDDDDDDDVPPGFGPPTTQHEDVDDLPEFKFSGGGGGPSPAFNPQSPTLSRSVDSVRQLIQKYGKTENGNGTSNSSTNSSMSMRGGIMGLQQGWDDEDEDDDDIPEWQPEVPPPPLNVASPMTPTTGGGWWRGQQDQGSRQQQEPYGQQGRQWRSDGNIRSGGRGY